MPRLQHILPYTILVLLAGGALFSCGPRKGKYTIDTLIEGYAYENELENNADKQEQAVELAEAKALSDSNVSDSAQTANDSTANASEATEPGTVRMGNIRVKALGRLAEVFNDSNYRQYAYAEKLGIEPITDLAKAYHTRRPMVKVGTNSDYVVDELTHSLPYLVPEASNLLSAIGRNFQDSLKAKGKARYKIHVTSLLRTPATVKKLRRVNINATDSSTHQFGTTFDISYHRFQCLDYNNQLSEEALKNVLAEVLYDLRKEGRCLVKFEIKTGCFHVTATK